MGLTGIALLNTVEAILSYGRLLRDQLYAKVLYTVGIIALSSYHADCYSCFGMNYPKA